MAILEQEGAPLPEVMITSVGSSGTGWDTEMPRFRSTWQTRYGSSGERWEDYEPSYRYGHELRSRPEYRGRSWTEVEPQLERDWTQRNPSTPWARARESVRDTWENATS